MDQIRFNYTDKHISHSIYIGQATNIAEARQVIMDSMDDNMDSYKDAIPHGVFFFGMKEM